MEQSLSFFLRALTSKPELRQLLQREIDERNFFLLCDSPFAQSSYWVQEEIAYVRARLSGKIYAEVNLDWPWERQKTALDELTKNTTVYLSYARSDARKITQWVDFLNRADFAVLKNRTKPNEESWEERIVEDATFADERGATVAFLSNSSLQQKGRWLDSQLSSKEASRRIALVELEPVLSLPSNMEELPRIAYSKDFETRARELLSILGLREPIVGRKESD